MARGFCPASGGKKSTPIWRASVWSCSIAAGRWTSQETSSGFFFCSVTSSFASFAAVVVLPEPCRPAKRTTAGGVTARSSAVFSPPMVAASSRCTTPTSARPGERLPITCSPRAASRTRAMKSRTTGRATSASRSARRTSRSAPWIFASVRRASPRIVLATRDRRSVRFSSTGGSVKKRGVNCADAGDSTLRRGVSPLRGARLPLLAHALARRECAARRPLGAGGDSRALRASYLAGLRHAVGAFRAALRFRAGALGDAVARRADLLGRKPVPRARRDAGAHPRARSRVRAAARALPRARRAAVHAFDRIPPAPCARHDRLRHVHDRGPARASNDAHGKAAARRHDRRAARCAATAPYHGAIALPRDPRGVRVPDAYAFHRHRILGNAVRAGDEVRPQDRVRGGLLVHLCRAARRALFLRLARAHRVALDARRLRRAPARLRGQPFRARGDPAARSRLGYTRILIVSQAFALDEIPLAIQFV